MPASPPERNPTEFEVHAEAYTQLKEAFPWCTVRGDLKLPRTRGQRGARPDLSVFGPDRKLMAILVIKRSTRGKQDSARAKAYEELHVPVITIRGIEDATNAPEIFRQAIAGGGL